jgi:heme-degrading monooxygenase HmoA
VADDAKRPPFAAGQVVTVFRSRRCDEAESEYQQVSAEMQAAARSVPGFVDFKSFSADDGERVSLVTFASLEAHRVWRNDPRHRQAQERGRTAFYLGYSIQVGECTHVSQWSRDA